MLDALKAKWSQRYLDPHNRGKWKLFVEFSLTGHDINLLLQVNLNSDDVASLGLEEPIKSLSKRGHFWILKKQLWGNTSLVQLSYTYWKQAYPLSYLVLGRYFLRKWPFGRGFQFLIFDTFKEKFAIKAHFLQYHGVICAISNIKRKNQCPQMKDAKTDTKSVLSSESFCKLAYKSFLTKSASVPCQSQEKWLADCKSFDFNTTDWGKSYTLAFLCTRESKLRVFQLKLRHGKLATNYFLFKIGIKSNDQCSFCNESPETFLLLFCECPFVKSFWKLVTGWKTALAFLTNNSPFCLA